MPGKVVVVGSSNIDLIMKMERLPRPGETVSEAEFAQGFGGKGANQAVAAARAGGDRHPHPRGEGGLGRGGRPPRARPS
jgi:ribokinase